MVPSHRACGFAQAYGATQKQLGVRRHAFRLGLRPAAGYCGNVASGPEEA